jgi:hypothetical protein
MFNPQAVDSVACVSVLVSPLFAAAVWNKDYSLSLRVKNESIEKVLLHTTQEQTTNPQGLIWDFSNPGIRLAPIVGHMLRHSKSWKIGGIGRWPSEIKDSAMRKNNEESTTS